MLNSNLSLSAFASLMKDPFRLSFDHRKPNVVAVLDEFSAISFSSALNLWLVDPVRPEIDLDHIEVDFLLVESAWAGNNGRWRYMVTSNAGPKEPLIRLVDGCRKRGIPTVFWNKEDPPHFEDFLMTAKLFDFVFTSDGDMIPSYMDRIPGISVDLLRFGADPAMHEPSWVDGFREGNFAFAGQYFRHKYPERREQMDILFPIAAEYGLDIYSRVLGGDERYQFPVPFDDLVVGSLPYNEMIKTYKRYKAFLNVNSVVSSSSMCARRVFELSACKTAVVGMESPAIRSIYDESEILLANNSSEADEICRQLMQDDLLRERLVQNAWRKTLSQHTYNHRVQQILKAIGQPSDDTSIVISLVLRSSGGDSARLRSELGSQVFTLDRPVRVEISEENDAPEFESVPQHESEYSCQFTALVDDRFEYGVYYLNDLLLSLLQSGASVAAKNLEGGKPAERETSDVLPEWGWISKAEAVTLDDDPTKTYNIYYSDRFDVGTRLSNRIVVSRY